MAIVRMWPQTRVIDVATLSIVVNMRRLTLVYGSLVLYRSLVETSGELHQSGLAF